MFSKMIHNASTNDMESIGLFDAYEKVETKKREVWAIRFVNRRLFKYSF